MRYSHVRYTNILLLLAGMSCTGSPVLAQNSLDASAAGEIRALIAEKATRNPAQMKLDSQLLYAAKMKRGEAVARGISTLALAQSALERNREGLIHVDIKAGITPELLALIADLGGRVENQHPQYQAVRAWLPLLAAEALAGRPEVRSIRPAAPARVNAGPDLNGKIAHAADLVQTLGISGAGAKVGVLSDGVDSLAAEQAAGRLPSTVNVLSGQQGSGSEGVALMEIIYSLAPAAQLYFATASGGDAQMATNILALSAAGCHIIVDDVTYLDEPVFQDGIIAQAVNSVTAGGVLYFSSAANLGNLASGTSGTWEDDFVDSGTSIEALSGLGPLNLFGTSNNNVLIKASASNIYSMQWADPFGASCNDYDLFILDASLANILGASTNVQNCSQDPWEFFQGAVPDNSTVVIVNAQGQAAPRAIHLDTEGGLLAVATSGATFGHNAAAATITVAATDVARAAGGIFTGGGDNPPEPFSADGPRKIFYDPSGNAITPGNFLFATNGGTTLAKVDLLAADGVTTGVTQCDPFYGTSAAVPHAAAVAALVMEAYPGWTPAQVKNALLSTALPVTGYDSHTVGSGIVIANRAAIPTPAGLTIQPDSLVSSAYGTITATLSGPAPAGGATISLSSNNAAFWTPPSIVIPAGQTSGSIQGQADLVVTITAATVTASYNGIQVTAEVTINPPDGLLAPAVTTAPASSITSNAATLNASINPNGSDTHVWFTYWSCTTPCTPDSTPQQDAGAGALTISPTANVTGLKINTIYSFQAWASNSAGTTPGSILTTTTGPQLQSQVITKAEPSGCSAPAKQTSFPPAASAAWVWFEVSHAGSGDQGRAEWYSPVGSLYSSYSWAPVAAPGQACFSNSLPIAGNSPASQPGVWTVKVYWDDSPLFTLPFTVTVGTAPSLVWMNKSTEQVTVNYFGGAGGATYQTWSWLANPGYPGWTVVGAADFDGNGTPDLVWMNNTTRQVTVHYYGGPGGTVDQGWAWLAPAGYPGWHVVAIADFDGNGVPDLVWMNDTTRQATVHYYGGAGGVTNLGWNWLAPAAFPGWTVVGAADFDQNGVPDLIWQNDTTRQVTVHYYGGSGGATDQHWTWLNPAGVPGWTVAGAADFNGDGVPDLVWQNTSSGQVTVHYYGGPDGASYVGWNWLTKANNSAWRPFVAQ